MPIVFQDSINAFNIRQFDGNSYKTIIQLTYENIVGCDTTINENGATSTLTVKINDQTNGIFSNPNVLFFERIIQDKKGAISNKIFVLADKEIKYNDSNISLVFTLINLTSVESTKIIGTTENVVITDPDNIPDNFYKYKDNGSFDDLLFNLYDHTFLDHQILAKGELLGSDSNRITKGLNSIITTPQLSDVKDVQYEANNTFLDTKKDLFELFELRSRSEFVLNNDILNIQIFSNKTININLISNPEDVQNLSYKIQKSTNFANLYNATGDLNIYSNAYNVQNNELTSVEIVEDSSSENGSDQNYVNNTAQSGLALNNKPLVFNLELKLNELTHYIDYNLFDIIQIEGIDLISGQYQIVEITENIATEGVDTLIKLDQLTANTF